MTKSDVASLNNRLRSISPEHDSPVGLIHPYWARKPLNIIQEIVSFYSNEGDIIADPFIGSGTTVFAALSQNRRIIAADLNPLAIFITRSIIELSITPSEKLTAIDQFVTDLEKEVLPWFHYKDNSYVERERFQVSGNYENGNFQLENSEIVIKEFKNGKLVGRKVEKVNSNWMHSIIPDQLLKYPINFEALSLLPNPRIAIKNGENLAHLFEIKNLAAINAAFRLIFSGKYGNENEDTLKLLISSSLPLLRLSDKKASSQWPYWRPKNQLTSRNPIPVIQHKAQAIKTAIGWLENHIDHNSKDKLYESLSLFNVPVQTLVPKYVEPKTIDLIITDPPYADQAPYLEYSSLWLKILDLPKAEDLFLFEIVKTDAPDRLNDSEEYSIRLGKAIETCSTILKPKGIMVWFYQDRNLTNWATISEATRKNNLFIQDVLPIAKQRRSMKTVTSPGKTFDGDLILVFRKKQMFHASVENIDHALFLIEYFLNQKGGINSYFDKSAIVIEVGLKYNLMPLLAKKFSDVREILTIIEERGNNVLAS